MPHRIADESITILQQQTEQIQRLNRNLQPQRARVTSRPMMSPAGYIAEATVSIEGMADPPGTDPDSGEVKLLTIDRFAGANALVDAFPSGFRKVTVWNLNTDRIEAGDKILIHKDPINSQWYTLQGGVGRAISTIAACSTAEQVDGDNFRFTIDYVITGTTPTAPDWQPPTPPDNTHLSLNHIGFYGDADASCICVQFDTVQGDYDTDPQWECLQMQCPPP